MKLFCLTDYKTPEGLFHLDIRINDQPKIYTYVLNSEYYHRKFLSLYRRPILHGKAFQILKEGNINKDKGYA